MRIGINGRFLAARPTGVQRFASAVVPRLAREHDVVLFLPRDMSPPADVQADTIVGRRRGHVWERLELPRVAAGHCDVLLHPANSGGSAAVPTVLVLHDVLPLTNPAWFSRRFALWYRATMARSARAAARIVTVSEWSRHEICRATRAAPGRVVVSPQGLAPFDAPASAEAVRQVRERYDLPQCFLLAVGADPRKNIDFLVDVLRAWETQHGTPPLLVCTGVRAARVHGSAEASALTTYGVRTLGRVSDAELHALYTAASALCFPALAEGFGRPPLEAVACGTPAVVAPYAAAGETLAGLDAVQIRPLDAVSWVSALRSALTTPAMTLAHDSAVVRNRWSWDDAAEVVYDACSAAWREAAASRPRSAAASSLSSFVRLHARREPLRDVKAQPRIAIVHDWLTGMRGGERVLAELLELYPTADVFTLVHVPGSVSADIEARVVATSFVDRMPAAHRAYRFYLPLFPRAAEQLDVSGYDVVISSSHCAAKGVRARGVPHVCYCHSPMRYVWDRYADYFGRGRAALPVRLAMRALAPRLRAWDVRTAAPIDRIVANSGHVRDRIRAYWHRDAAVVYPPVDVERFTCAQSRDDYYVVAGALVPYKRVDLAVEAFGRLGRRLIVVGDGPEYTRLRAHARGTIEFAGAVSDDEMATLLARARGLVMPMVEDFGIIAVEAQAAGTPVIAFGAGGALETVIGWSADAPSAATGVFFTEQTPDALAAAVRAADEIVFDTDVLRAHARQFGRAVFQAGIRSHVAALLDGNADAGARRLDARELVTSGR